MGSSGSFAALRLDGRPEARVRDLAALDAPLVLERGELASLSDFEHEIVLSPGLNLILLFYTYK